MEQQGCVKDFESTLLKKNGEIIAALETSCVLRDGAGEAAAYAGIIRDVTRDVKSNMYVHRQYVEPRQLPEGREEDPAEAHPAGKTRLDRTARRGYRPRAQQPDRIHLEQFHHPQILRRDHQEVHPFLREARGRLSQERERGPPEAREGPPRVQETAETPIHLQRHRRPGLRVARRDSAHNRDREKPQELSRESTREPRSSCTTSTRRSRAPSPWRRTK